MRRKLFAPVGALSCLLLLSGTTVTARMSARTENLAVSFINYADDHYFVHDMNGDSMADLIRVECWGTAGTVTIGYSRGAGTNTDPSAPDPRQGFDYPYDIRLGSSQYPICMAGESADVADIDGDGIGEILIYDKREANTKLDVVRIGPESINRSTLINQLPSNGSVARPIDVDGDGDLDLVVFDLNGGDVHAYLASAPFTFNHHQTPIASGFAYGDHAPAVSTSMDWTMIQYAGHSFAVAAIDRITGSLKYQVFRSMPITSPTQSFLPLGGVQSKTMVLPANNTITQAFLADMNRDAMDDVVVFAKHQLTPPHDINHRNMYVAIYDTYNHDSYCSWRNPVALCAQDPQTYQGEYVLWFSEYPPEQYGDTRVRTFGLGDVDSDGYLDYVMFPSIPETTGTTTSHAIVRFQLVLYLALYHSTTTNVFYPDTHDHAGSNAPVDLKHIMDPFVTLDDAHFSIRPGNEWNRVSMIDSFSGTTSTLAPAECGGATGYSYSDIDGVSDYEYEAMYRCAVGAVSGMTPKQWVELSHTEGDRGIHHRSRIAGIFTTTRYADWNDGLFSHGGCDWSSEVGWTTREALKRDKYFMVFSRTIKKCFEWSQARTIAHEFGHVLGLGHWGWDTFDGTNTIMSRTGDLPDPLDYHFYWSVFHRMHFEGQLPNTPQHDPGRLPAWVPHGDGLLTTSDHDDYCCIIHARTQAEADAGVNGTPRRGHGCTP